MNDGCRLQLPPSLPDHRLALILDLCRLWQRLTDFRFGQTLRAAVSDPVKDPSSLPDAALTEALPHALNKVPDRAPPKGPYWDTETKDGRSFLNGLPRDPTRIPRVLEALATAWVAYPNLELGQLIEFALDRASIPENQFGTRWLLIEDATLRRALEIVIE